MKVHIGVFHELILDLRNVNMLNHLVPKEIHGHLICAFTGD